MFTSDRRTPPPKYYFTCDGCGATSKHVAFDNPANLPPHPWVRVDKKDLCLDCAKENLKKLLPETCGSCSGWDEKGSTWGYCTCDPSGLAVKTDHNHLCHVPPALAGEKIEEDC
jgi:hypothetical protein